MTSSRTAPADAAASVPLTARHKRAAEPAFAQWSLAALGPHLPLRFPVPADLPPSPKRHYRSCYRPPEPSALGDPSVLASKSDFEIALLVLDFSRLEALLAQHYRPSRKGQVPFHPVSLFLAICLRRELLLSWAATARLFAGEHGALWRSRFGFADGPTPSASGLRFFFHAVGASVFDDVCPRFVVLLRQADLFPTHSTFPSDPPNQGITVCQDGMLHAAHDQSHCFFAQETCSRPLPPAIPLTSIPASGAAPVLPSRPCPAQEKGHTGCSCTSEACARQCQRASATDREARFIHYAGHNHKHPPPTSVGDGKRASNQRGRDVFGYRSVAERVVDDRFAVAWTVRSTLYPATTDERTIFAEQFVAVQRALPTLPLGEWLDDAGVGYGPCLDVLWEAGVLRMVDIRADKSDADPQACLRRGYDAVGRPLCPHGYPLRANGYDHARRRAKYVCAQACRREPRAKEGSVTPIDGCPYLDPTHPLGFVVNVGRTLPDGSTRLARDIPYGSPTWKARYARRNLAESRNAQIEAMGLKRLPSSGMAHGAKEIQIADFLINLRTVGRLVREASTH